MGDKGDKLYKEMVEDLNGKDQEEATKNLKNPRKNYCGDKFFIKREIGDPRTRFSITQKCSYCPSNFEPEVTEGKDKGKYKFKFSDLTNTDPYFKDKFYSELSDERKDDLLMCGKFLNNVFDGSGSNDAPPKNFFNESDKDRWIEKQQAYDMRSMVNLDLKRAAMGGIMGPECNTDQINALNEYNTGNEETKKDIRKKTRSILDNCTLDGEPAWRQTIPKDIRGSRYHGGDNFKRCVYGKLRIRDGDRKHKKVTDEKKKQLIDEKLNLLMNAPYRKIHSCLEETDVHKDCRDGYSHILLSLMGKDTSEGPPGTDTPLTETQFKDRLARRHLVHLAGRMEYNDCGFVSNDTEAEKDKYDNPMYNVSFNVNIIETVMDFITKLVGQSKDSKGEFRLIESGMRLATFFVMALILYMFTRLLLK